MRIRPPAVSKGTKNFMSPTVSAASKITASPRKKVLVERNELIRTSVSSASDGKSIFSSLNIQEVVEDLNSKPASSDSTVVDPDQSPSKAYKDEEVLDSQVPKSKNDSEFLSKTIADQSLPPYDPKTNFLSPRPLFLHYKPNPRIEKIRLRECNRLEDYFTSESLSDTETTEETESENSFSTELMERQNEEVEESEAALEETARVEPNVSEPFEAKVVGQSHSVFRLRPISLLLFVLLVWCLWIPPTDSPLISSVIDSCIGRQSSFTQLYEPTDVAKFARTNFDKLTRHFWLWSTNTVSYFSKMIPTAKESNKLSFLGFGNFTDLVKQQNLQWPMMKMQIGIVQLKELNEAYEKGEDASQVNPEDEDAKLIEEAEIIEPDCLTDSELERNQEYRAASNTVFEQASQGQPEVEQSNLSLQDEGEDASQVNPEDEHGKLIEEAEIIEPDCLTDSELEQNQEYHAASHTVVEQASQGKPEVEQSNLSPQDEVAEPHTLEVQQTEEESKLISREAHGILAEKEQEVSHVSEIELEAVVEPHTLEVQQTEEESKLISHEAHGILAEKEQEVSHVSEIELEAVVEAPHIDNEAQSIIFEMEMESQVPQVSEIESELSQAEKLLGENKLIPNAEVESSVPVSEPESSESEALIEENSQSFKELYLSLKEKSSTVNALGISVLILILTVTAAFKIAKQQKSPTPNANAIPMDQLQAKKLASMPTASVENTHQERMSSKNWATEVDMVGESCPSEISSFQRTTSFSKKESKGASEAQSQERVLRRSNKRESLASSSEYSMGSPSYGSYTSYEKIHKQVSTVF